MSTLIVNEAPRPHLFEVRRGFVSVMWRWENFEIPEWRMCEQISGVQFADDGPLTDYGKQLLLEKFWLWEHRHRFPLEKLRFVSPARLYECAVRYAGAETRVGEVVSDNVGDSVPARLAA